jgi:hypothetical protein
VFYRTLGLIVWRLAIAYVRQNYGRRIKAGAGAAAFLAVLGIGYLFTRGGDEG